MLSINFNPSVLKAQNSLNIANLSLNKSLQRLTTGLRINSAKDDPAGFYVAQGLNSQIRGLKTAQSNIAMGSSMLGIAEGALGSMTKMLDRLNDLALQGASTTMTASARETLIKEADSLVEEIKKVNANTKFNGVSVFGSAAPKPQEEIVVSSLTTDVIPEGFTAIYSADDLININNNLSGAYILMNDIDLSSVADWDPIAKESSFKGILNGNGHVIKNLTSSKGGLFHKVSGCTIENLGLENIDINATNPYDKDLYLTVGAFSSHGDVYIYNCYSTGTIKSDITPIAGLCSGGNGSTIINNSYSTCTLDSSISKYGLAGNAYSISMNNCYFAGTMAGSGISYSFFGSPAAGDISNCYTTNNGNMYSSTYGTIHAANVFKGSQIAANKNKFSSDTWDTSTDLPTLKNMPIATPPKVYDFSDSKQFRLQVGPGSAPAANAMYFDTGINLSGLEVDLSDPRKCLESSNAIRAALNAVAQKTSDIGITQSILETTSNINTTKIENLTAAYSTVTGADVAEEVANYTKSQILADTASSLIIQTQAFQNNLILNMINSLWY